MWGNAEKCVGFYYIRDGDGAEIEQNQRTSHMTNMRNP